MSRPSSPAARRSRLLVLVGLARLRAFSSTSAASARFTTQTPSSSATITSPGSTAAPAQTIGTLTEPSVALTVPCANTAFDQTGKVHLRQVAHVAHAGVDDQAAAAARLRARWPAGRRNSRPRTGWSGRGPGCRPPATARSRRGPSSCRPAATRWSPHCRRSARRDRSAACSGRAGRCALRLVDGGDARMPPARRRPPTGCGGCSARRVRTLDISRGECGNAFFVKANFDADLFLYGG